MYILGLSFYYHDAAAVLIENGHIIAAAEEERFSRKKHDAGFPHHAIDFCLKLAGINAEKIDYVVFYEKPFRKLQRILFTTLTTYPKSYASFREAMRVWMTQKLWVKQDIINYLKLSEDKIYFSEHHLSHAASTFYPSSFKEAAILTIDGVGEWTTTSYATGSENKIVINKEMHFPHSLGLLYSAFTAFLGFEVNEGEWKVMGLAPYGKPKYTKKIWKVVHTNKDGSFSLDLSYFAFHHSDSCTYSQKFIDLFGKSIDPQISYKISPFAADMAASIQKVSEDLLLNMTQKIYQETKLPYLCLAGGVALNSVANYKLLQQAGFKQIFIQPAAGDSGGAMGAALYFYHHVLGNKKRVQQTHAYFGQNFTNQEIKKFIYENKIKAVQMSEQRLLKYIVDQISQGKVIGWMQGKFEWGPRALGNRSILADARNPKMKEIINSKVKFREAFRPFAPSVLADRADLVFELPPNYSRHQPLQYMLYVVPVKKQWQKVVPAITHQDHSARPQLVSLKENALYYKLISTFYKKTKVPLILNTSFNLKGEPIVTTPKDAYSTFIRSGIDILVMGNFICEK